MVAETLACGVIWRQEAPMSTDHTTDEIDPEVRCSRTTEDKLDDVLEENESLRERVDELEAENERLDALVTGALNRINELEDRLDDDEATQSETELGVALEAPPDVVEDRYSVAEQRAIIIAKHLSKIGGPNGAKVNKRLLRVVERERDESLEWSQLYRSCEALEELSRKAVRFVDDDGGPNRLHVEDSSVLP